MSVPWRRDKANVRGALWVKLDPPQCSICEGLTGSTAAPEVLLCFLVCVKPQAAEMVAWCEGRRSFPG